MNKELKVSYEILKKIYIDGAYVSIELNKFLSTGANINNALVTKIVYGVLEKDISLEYFVSHFVKKLPKIEILILLKMVTYVAKNISSIPPFALVNEIVNLSKGVDPHQSGFVNATCKNLIAKKVPLPNRNTALTKYLSVRYNYPEWVIIELLKKHNLDFVEALLSEELPSDTHVRVNLDKISADDFKSKLTEKGIRYTDGLSDELMYVDYAELLKTDLKDLCIVQGLPSIITCKAMGAVRGKVLDTCAAPGGKSVYLAQNRDLDVYACDIHKHRVELIKKYAKSLQLDNVKCFEQDATKPNSDWVGKFDYVMCDVPCSNLGVSRKKPDVFLNKSLSDVKTLAGLQYQILNNSAKYVKSGGILQYSTCTILDNENSAVITKFLKNNPDFTLTKIDTFGLNITDENSMYTFYPNLTHTEGFFIGRMVRK
ncbi:MAG: 16S rRNA (cytosine(967)-C(5))-methyltransferase RsmB [Clostridiales bacterium]|nr:16S rRNA (cytosine(967)-C(5))-methyltransferase RsmB [Clostridiales bacterium]